MPIGYSGRNHMYIIIISSFNLTQNITLSAGRYISRATNMGGCICPSFKPDSILENRTGLETIVKRNIYDRESSSRHADYSLLGHKEMLRLSTSHYSSVRWKSRLDAGEAPSPPYPKYRCGQTEP